MSRTVRENLNPNVRKEPLTTKPVSRISRPTPTPTTTRPATTRPTAATRLVTAAATAAKPVPTRSDLEKEQQAKEWKERVSQMESVVGQLASQVTLLTEQLTTSNRQKDQLEQAVKEVQGMGQALQQYAQQPIQVQYQMPQIEADYEPKEPEVFEEPDESSSEEEPEPTPTIDTSVFTEELQKISAQKQEILQSNTEAEMAHRVKMDSLEFEQKRTQISLDTAQSLLQTTRNENTANHVLISQKEADIRKLANEIKSTTERLTRECQAVRERLTEETNQTKKKYESQIQEKKTTLENTSRKKALCLEKIRELEGIAQRQQEVIDVLEEKAQDAESTRKKLCADIQDLKGSIRVLCRIRPLQNTETTEPLSLEFPESNPMELLVSSNGQKNAYHYDRVFSPTATQSDIYSEVSYLLENTFKGKNSCVFCYGQSQSGKSFTMYGSEGLAPSLVSQALSQTIQADWEYALKGSLFEIRNEKLNDIGTGKEDLQIKQIRNGFTEVVGSTPNKIESLQDLEGLLQAAKNRTQTPNHNVHTIFQLLVKATNVTTKEQREATLSLVELNQSEKHKQGEDSSLVTLGNVFGALSNNSKTVPFKDSKLTDLLQYSLGGDSKALMIVHISPLAFDYKHTLNSLQFASKVYSCEIGNGKKSQSK